MNKKPDIIPPLPGQLDIEKELEKQNGKQTRISTKRTLHRRISRPRKKGVAASAGKKPSAGFCGFARFANTNRLPSKDGKR